MDTSVAFPRFNGLRLDLPVDEVPQEEAIALLDVFHAANGELKTRWGTQKFSTGTSIYYQIYCCTIGGKTFILTYLPASNKIVALKENGEPLAVSTAAAGGTQAVFTLMGTPTSTYVYIGGTGNPMARFNGTEFTTPTATVDGVAAKQMPLARAGMAVWPEGGNRLVFAGTSGEGGPGKAASSESHVWFSEPGNAEGYESTAYEQLTPGDTERIQGLCYWNGCIYVFKQTKFFVFSGVSADEEGKPIFNYRVVFTGGARIKTRQYYGGPTIVPTREGVYFLTDQGLYITNGSGSAPAKASRKLDSLLYGETIKGPAKALFEGENRSLNYYRMVGIEVFRDKLFIPMYELTAKEGEEPAISRVLVYDPPRDEWFLWSGKIRCMAAGGGIEQQLYFSAFPNSVWVYNQTATEDASLPGKLEPLWQSGFYSLGSEDQKTLSENKLWGAGEITMTGYSDYKETADPNATATVKLGVNTEQSRPAFDQRATFFSHLLKLAPGATIQKLVRYQASTDVPRSQNT